MARHALLVAPLLLATIAWASGGCSSVPTLHFAEDDASVGGDGGDSGSSGGPCVKTGNEICDDGIDNDCNGETDCADDACTARFTCVDRGPEDWQLTALAEGSRPGCPSGYGDSKDVRSTSGAVTCGCDCGGGATCVPAGIAAGFDSDNTCNANTETLSVKASCDRLQGNGFSVGANTFVKATAGVPGACGGTKTGTPSALRDGRTCVPPKVGAGCNSGQVCVPRPNNNYAVCVSKPGSVACPAGFPSPHHLGTAANDTRACGTCTCTSTPCAGELKLYDNRDCENGVKLTVQATALPGTCSQGTNAAFQARGYTATVTGGCVVGTPAPTTGALTFTNEATVCCK